MTRDEAIALANTKFAEHHPEWCSETPVICECTIAAILEAAKGAEHLLAEVATTMDHARVFITSREKMHPTGVELWDELRARIAAKPSAEG